MSNSRHSPVADRQSIDLKPPGGSSGAIPPAVCAQALHAFELVRAVPGWQVVDGAHVLAVLHSFPYPQVIEPSRRLTEADVDAAVCEARALVRDHGREVLVWLTGPDHPWLGDALSERGLRNEDSAGFESVENAMALVRAPIAAVSDVVTVSEVDSFEEFADSMRVEMAAFEVAEDGRARMEAEIEQRFAEYAVAGSPYARWIAWLDDRVVGTAGAVFGEAAVNLFGGGVLPDARGRGVYRALVNARWEAAVRRGTPALTVQAGRMSRPPLERLGFEFIAAMRTYVDDFAV